MNRLLLIRAILVLALVAAPARTWAAADKGVHEALSIETKVNNAMVNSDTATLDQLLGDELTAIGANGQTATKAEVLNWFRSRQVKYDSMESLDSKIRAYGNVVVMNTTQKILGRAFGNDISGRYLVTAVLVKRGGRWQEVQRITTRIVLPELTR